MDVELADVVVDCVDPEAVAAFWGAVLGRDVGGRLGPYVFLAPAEGQIGMAFQRTDEPRPTGKQRVHVDLRVDDVRAAQRTVEASGGSRVPGYGEGGFLVMADPEGNMFCLLPKGDLRVDAEGRAHYLDQP